MMQKNSPPKLKKLKQILSSFLGLRTLKTVLAVMIAALFMKYALHQAMFFACLGAVVAMERTIYASLRAVLIRNVGTLTGGLMGILIASFTDNIILISLGLIPVIIIQNVLHRKESIVPSAIVYLAITYLNTSEIVWVYGISRILGTFIGTMIGLLVNTLILPPQAELEAENKPVIN